MKTHHQPQKILFHIIIKPELNMVPMLIKTYFEPTSKSVCQKETTKNLDPIHQIGITNNLDPINQIGSINNLVSTAICSLIGINLFKLHYRLAMNLIVWPHLVSFLSSHRNALCCNTSECCARDRPYTP